MEMGVNINEPLKGLGFKFLGESYYPKPFGSVLADFNPTTIYDGSDVRSV